PESVHLQADYTYAPSGNFPKRYHETYSLGFYATRYQALMGVLFGSKNQNKHVVLMGHSEGARIAAIVGHHPAVDQVVCLSANPFGRQAGIILEQRLGHRPASDDPLAWDIPQRGQWDTLHDSRSFHAPMINRLLELQKPLFIGYGTLDYGALDNDKLPILFGDAGKSRWLTLRTWEGRGHNFFGRTPEGEIDYADYYWDAVWAEIVTWIRKPA
ncbi:MAG: hypothetical protein AAFV07_07305, partial [Bacteroidota bacterium]